MFSLEVLASLLIVANVVLVARRSIWNYAFAIAGTAIYGWVFFEARLYSDTGLQLFFVIVNLYGWRHWSRGIATAGEVRVGRLSAAARASTKFIGRVPMMLHAAAASPMLPDIAARSENRHGRQPFRAF